MIFAARRRAGLSTQEFYRYWTETHAALAAAIPGVVRYVVRLPSSDRDAEARPFDGFAEITYADRATLRAAAQSPAVAATLADEVNLFDTDSIVRLWVTDHVIV